MRRFALFVIIFIVLAAGLASVFPESLMLFNNKVEQVFEEGKTYLVVEGEMAEAKEGPRITDGEILLPLELVKKHIDPYIWWDGNLNKVTITTKDRVIRMNTNGLTALVNNKPIELKIPVTSDNGVIYIPIDFLKDFYGIEINHRQDSNAVIIDFKNSIRQLAEPVSDKAVVRKGRSWRYPILKKYDKSAANPEDNVMRVFEEYDKWYKVRTAEGIVGYIEKKYVVVKRSMVRDQPQPEKPEQSWKPENGRINLVWDMLYSKPDLTKMSRIEGLDILSPTWFEVQNDKGNLTNRSDAAYVDWAHKNGYKVWALVANNFKDIDATSRLLNNTDARDTVIRELLAYSALYKLDGINIDFENIYKQDKDALTQFVRELTPLLKEQGLIVSMDITVPDGSDTWSLCFDRKAIGQTVDYVMLMTYDQHYSTSPVAGSVAQMPWVEKNLKKVLEVVPREKLLLGIPFYTRFWKEEADASGKVKVTNDVTTMEQTRKLVKENNAPVKWDEASGQFYAEYKKGSTNFKVWMEDENSINLKTSLVQKYKLAGAAAWRKTDETPEIWNVLNRNLKVLGSYQEWMEQNKDRKYTFN